MILLDPEQFRRSHAIHHAQVNTYGDTMVYPFGRIARRPWRIAYAVGEVFGGDLFVFLATLCLPQRAGQQSGQKHGERRANFRPPAIVYSLAFFAATAAVSWLLLGVTIREIAVAYFLDLWLLGLVMRHNLMIQHRNVLSTAPHHQRAMLTRNLLAHGPLARLFLLLTHQECGNHVLHHVAAPLNARAAPHAVAVPAGAVYITLGDYARVLGQLLLGREPAGYGISGSSTFSKRNGTSTSSAPLTT